MVQAQRTYTKHTSTELARCVGCLCTSSGWFKHIEPHRTYTINTITELARCVGCLCTSSGWFKLGVVRLYRTFSMNLLEPQQHKASKVWRGLSQEFRVVRLYRTFSSYSIAGETRCAGCLCTSSGWFKHIEPPRTYSNHNFTELARLGSMRFDVLEPPRTSAKAPCTPGFPCTAVAREGSVQSNHPELL